MLITVEATYEGGVLKLRQSLPLEEHQAVQVTVQTDKAALISGPAVTSPHEVPPLEPGASADPSAPGDSLDFGEYEMVDIWLNVPPSPDARTVIARRATILPGPYKIDESDLAPE